MTARSYLFVPGDRGGMLTKASDRGADALIVDLEDAVTVGRKGLARQETRAWLSARADLVPSVWVRINNERGILEDDIAAVLCSGLTGLVVPKVDSVEQLRGIAEELEFREVDAGLERGRTALIPMVETGLGLLSVADIAKAPRVERLMIGEVDLAADLLVDPEDDTAMTALRLPLVVASAAAAIEPPVGPVSLDYQDLDRFRNQTITLRRIGFRARPAIHPSQIEVINAVFTPTPEEIQRARRLLHLYEQAETGGRGAVVDDDGRMVDRAVIRAARSVVELTDRLDGS